MDSHEKTISEFKEYARATMDEHAEVIRTKYTQGSISNEERLQVFNTQLTFLKDQLQQKIKAMTELTSGNDGLSKKLFSVYDRFINEFYKKEF